MARHRDWASTLRPASFRGVPFEVDDEEVRNLLRQAVHEVPNGMWRLERLGRGPTELSLVGFVASRTADAEGDAVAATFRDDKPGMLVMPMVGPVKARPLSCTRSRKASRHGYVALDMRWLVEPVRGAAASPAQAANNVFTATSNLLGSIAGTAASVVGMALQIAGTASSAIAMVGNIVSAVVGIYNLATSIASAATAVTTTELSLRTGEIGRGTEAATTLLTDLGQAAIDLGFGMDPVAVASGSFRPMLDVAPSARPSAAPSAAAAFFAESGLASFAHVVAVAVEAEALARRDWRDQQEVGEALSSFLTHVDSCVEELSGLGRLSAPLRPGFSGVLAAPSRSDAVTPAGTTSAGAALDALRSAVVEYLSIVSRDLAPLVFVETNRSQPAIVWAYALYEEPGRAGELARSNRVRSPSFMPLRFRAKAPAGPVAGEI
ncbi:DNA circularization N-terminal domain-containing protein [Bosea sp. TWI1241]|uniref:DNA circularization N-terminal domain-containing protein n=1 Tax=Bosea sp. TWI1241 TaxID=3148904 RepID=UPI00320A99F0